MRKLCWAFVLMTAMVLLCCSSALADKDPDPDCYHMASCSVPDTCVKCGGVGLTLPDSQIEHPEWEWDDPSYAYDEYQHWWTCRDCGANDINDYYDVHRADCTAPDTCYDCGAKGVIIKSFEHLDNGYGITEQVDALYHGYQCSGCNEWVKSPHKIDCYDMSNPDCCIVCGADGVTIGEYEHCYSFYNGKYTCLDEMYHCLGCSGCGVIFDYTLGMSKHKAMCDTPDVCMDCGVTGVTMCYFFHQGEENMFYDETHHWYGCSDCELRSDAEEHYVRCTNSDVCAGCGVAVSGNVGVFHENSSEWQWDENTHWEVCEDCGGKARESNHWMRHCTGEEKNECWTCGAQSVVCEFDFHSYEEYFDEGGEPVFKGVYLYDEKEHWIVCSRCGDVKREMHKFYNLDSCVDCGYEKPAYVPGDADGSGSVDILDALAVLQVAVGWGTSINHAAADVDCSGTVDIMDALLILQYAVGWDVELE